MHHTLTVHAHDISKQIKSANHRVENVIKQLVHTSAVRSSRYKALGKFGEHSRGYSYASSDFGRVSEKISSIGKEKVNN